MTQTQTRPPARLGGPYWRLWWANTVSSTGDGAFIAALPLLAVTITRDPRLVSVVTAATFLPWLLLSLPAGALVDRYDRVTLMWRAQVVQAVVVAAVTVAVLARRADIAVLGVAGLLVGSAEVVFSNAAQAILPALVPPELLPKANGSQQVSLTVGESFVGPPIGSLLFAAAAALPFGMDAASFAGSAALVATLPKAKERAQDVERPTIRAGRRGPPLAGPAPPAAHGRRPAGRLQLREPDGPGHPGPAGHPDAAPRQPRLRFPAGGVRRRQRYRRTRVPDTGPPPGLPAVAGHRGSDRRRRLRRHRAGPGPGRGRGHAGRPGLRRQPLERRDRQPAPADRPLGPPRPGQQRVPHAGVGPDADRRAGR